QLFRNEGGRFVDVSAESGKEFARMETSRAAAFGDIDNDGDVDILLTNCNGPARLLLNQVGQKRRSLRVTLRGVHSDHFALGARVAAERPGAKPVWRHVSVDGSYLSSSDNRILFGLGEQSAPQSLLVVWPDGSRERFPLDAEAREVELTQGEGTNP
ncbi:MAG: CRTAC1 family protein, partial [Bryobacterales bacterium]|nr:CRTAC1 family protein [Bryobacterales bacterium]